MEQENEGEERRGEEEIWDWRGSEGSDEFLDFGA